VSHGWDSLPFPMSSCRKFRATQAVLFFRVLLNWGHSWPGNLYRGFPIWTRFVLRDLSESQNRVWRWLDFDGSRGREVTLSLCIERPRLGWSPEHPRCDGHPLGARSVVLGESSFCAARPAVAPALFLWVKHTGGASRFNGGELGRWGRRGDHRWGGQSSGGAVGSAQLSDKESVRASRWFARIGSPKPVAALKGGSPQRRSHAMTSSSLASGARFSRNSELKSKSSD